MIVQQLCTLDGDKVELMCYFSAGAKILAKCQDLSEKHLQRRKLRARKLCKFVSSQDDGLNSSTADRTVDSVQIVFFLMIF